MGVATGAGAFYALIVFLIGFIFGTIRVLVLAPRLGDTEAVSLEIPIMLAASWFVCRWCVDRFDVPRTVPARSVMPIRNIRGHRFCKIQLIGWT
jgi:hypothetical protein